MGKNFLRRLWNSLPVRWQIMMAIAVLSMLAGGIVGAAAIIDARSRAQVEVTASLELAGRLMKEFRRSVNTRHLLPKTCLPGSIGSCSTTAISTSP